MPTLNEAAWKRLIRQIADGMVVPVIGPQLMVDERGHAWLQAELAERLRRRHGLDKPRELPRFRELNAVVGELRAAQVNLQDVYGDVAELIEELGREVGERLPEPLTQLAAIADFRLIVTLTPDDLLARALRRRVAVNEIVHSPYLPSSEDRDLPQDWRERQAEVQLLYLFGKARMAPMFAIHDEDVLEYAHNLIARGSHARERFVGELRQRNVLLIGSNFPDWLSRFFLRTTNSQRLLADRPKRDWLVEESAGEASLKVFLTDFGRNIEQLEGLSPRQFVAELHARWKAERGGVGKAEGAAAAEPAAAQGAMFFISYCRQTDAPAAARLAATLQESLGVAAREVWYDREVIEPGARFAASITEGIRSCRYFLPLVSRPSDAIAEKYFREEWREALARERRIMGETFVVPLIVDADYQPQAYRRVPTEWVDNLDFGHAPAGLPDERTAGLLRRLVRRARAPAGAP